MTTSDSRQMLCASGRHPWRDPEDRCRCCNGYTRVQSTSRADLEAMGAQHIVLRGMWRGWLRQSSAKK